MKKCYLFLMCILTIFLTGCCYTIEKNSLEEYKHQINRAGLGFSDFELDHPDYLLPSLTFLNDYEYITGSFYFYENSSFCDLCEEKWKPDRVLISLNYNEENYYMAKECVLNSISVYDEKYYFYKDYQFYVNQNFMDRFDDQYRPQIPNWFTMVCYNDLNKSIILLGFHNSYPKLDDKYIFDLDKNWISFIDQYYGEYYNFNE